MMQMINENTKAGRIETMTLQQDTFHVPAFINEKPLGASQYIITLLCGLVMFLDGFDTQSISYMAPQIAKEWGLSRELLGPIFSSALTGLMAGYLILSPLSDRFGHRRMILVSTVAFGLVTLITAFATNVTELIVLRFVTGLFLGAAIPSAVALTGEYSPKRFRATFVLIIYCGFSLGFVAAGALAASLLPLYGWRSLLWVGAIAPLVLSIFLFFFLMLYMMPIMFTFFFLNLAEFYALQSWLPTILTNLHYPLPSVALATTLTTVGGIVIAIVIGPAMDRLGPYLSLSVLYLLGVFFVSLMGVALSYPEWVLMVATFFAGCCVSGGQKSVIALSAVFYPAPIRSTGVGWALGIGRIGGIGGPLLIGWLLGWQLSPASLFYAASIPMLIASLLVALLGWRYGTRTLTPKPALAPSR